jgi:heat shock protein HtpX
LYSQIAANKRRSVIVTIVFFLTWLAIGAVCGLIARTLSRPPHTWTPVLDGVAICAFLAVCGIVYSLNAGAGLVLRVSGAVPADAIRYRQLHDLVEALAIGDGIPKPDVYVIDDPILVRGHHALCVIRRPAPG